MGGATGSTAAASHSSRRLPGTRAAFQCMLGQRHAQLLVSIACVVPFFCSQLGQLEPDSELLQGLQECMHALSEACCSHGLAQLGNKLQLFAEALNVNSSSGGVGEFVCSQQQHMSHGQADYIHHHQQQHMGNYSTGQQTQQQGGVKRAAGEVAAPGHGLAPPLHQQHGSHFGPSSHISSALQQLMQPLCLQLSRALLPTFADWLLRFWMGVLLLPGAAALHTPVLLLLRCLFDTPGLQLGPAAALLLDSAFLSPVVTLAQVGAIALAAVACTTSAVFSVCAAQGCCSVTFSPE